MGFSFKYTRYSAIAQITLGVLSIVFGIADRAVMYTSYAFHSESVVPIWMGVWFGITGVIGVYGTMRSYASNGRASRSLIGTYLAFSIVSTVFAAVIIIMYTIGVLYITSSPCRYATEYVTSRPYDHYHPYAYKSVEKECNTSVAMGSLVIIFAILEFCVGIWASICACNNGCCDCCNPTMQQPTQLSQGIIHLQTQHGPQACIITRGANGVSVAVPAMIPGQVQMPAGANGVPVAVPAMAPGQVQMPAGANGVPVAVPAMAQGQVQMPAGANGVPVAVPAMAPGQVQMPSPPASQAMYPSPARAPGGGAQVGGTHDALLAPPLQTKSTDMPPVYQP